MGEHFVMKIDEVIIPIFGEIIDYCDHHCNLDLIHSNMSKPVKMFWLSIFKCPDILSTCIDYSDLESKSSIHPMSEMDYKCTLPFSWVINEWMNSLWSNLITGAGTLFGSTCIY